MLIKRGKKSSLGNPDDVEKIMLKGIKGLLSEIIISLVIQGAAVLLVTVDVIGEHRLHELLEIWVQRVNVVSSYSLCIIP